MSTLLSFKDNLMSVWEAGLPAKELPATDVLKDRWESIATAVLSAGDVTIGAATINNGVIVGGAAPPAGPVVGAIMSAAPGALLSPVAWEAKSVFVPPTTVIQGYPVVYTDWLRVLQETISDEVSAFWSSWYPLWMCSGVSAVGGVAGYVPPGTGPGAPGPWTAGTIVPFTLVGSQGASSSPVTGTFKSTLVAKAKATEVSMWNGQQTTLIPAANEDVIQGTIEAFADAFIDTFTKWSTTALVTDVLGTSAVGIAAPPAGTITSGSINGLSIL
jgi:hypothetical protein